MIDKLTLNQFGKFLDKTFKFSPVTVFYGKNESGKTTIFDALFDALCKPRGTSVAGRELKKRYGDAGTRNSAIDFIDDAFACNDDEFLNLYAVKAGDLTTQLGSGGNWVSKIQASLFTGGIDPVVLRDDLLKDASEKGSLTHMRLLTKKQEEKGLKKIALQEKQHKRTAILLQEKELEKAGEDLADLTRQIEQKEEERSKFQEAIRLQKDIHEKNRLFNILKNIDAITDNSQRLKDLAIYAEDRSSEVLDLQNTVQEYREECVRREADVNSIRKDVDEISKEASDRHGQAEAVSLKMHPLSALQEQIDRDEPRPVIRQRVRWNFWVVMIGLLLIVAGAATGFITRFSHFGIILTGVGLAAGATALFLARKTDQVEDTADLEAFIKSMMKHWREIVGADHEEIASLAALRENIVKMKLGYEQSMEAYRQIQDKLRDKKEELATAEEAWTNVVRAREEAEKARAAWFENMEIESLRQYDARIMEYVALKKEIETLNQNLLKEISNYQCDDLGALKSKARVLAEGYEQRLSGIDAVSDTELVRYRNERTKISEEIEKLREKEAELAGKVNMDTGRISGALEDLPELIISLMREITLLDKDIRNIEFNRRAAGLAAEIFEVIAEDSSFQFNQLSREIAEMYDEFLPGSESIRMTSFNEEDIFVKDGSGKHRSPDQLSSGTRDAFWLAARLVLAVKARPVGQGIIALDEPFHSFDDERMRLAVMLLKKFRDNTNWQLVFFTKDKPVAEAVKGAFGGEAILHEL